MFAAFQYENTWCFKWYVFTSMHEMPMLLKIWFCPLTLFWLQSWLFIIHDTVNIGIEFCVNVCCFMARCGIQKLTLWYESCPFKYRPILDSSTVSLPAIRAVMGLSVAFDKMVGILNSQMSPQCKAVHQVSSANVISPMYITSQSHKCWNQPVRGYPLTPGWHS